MARKMAQYILLLVLLIPVSGYGLGLGDIIIHSSLNQPLYAEIGLHSVKKGEHR